MAENTEAPATNADPLDSQFLKPTAAQAPTPPPPPPAVPVDDRPRNADGTFKKSAEAHPPYIVEAARTFGYTQDEIDTTPPDQLNREIHRIYRTQQAERQQNALQRTFDASAARTQEATPAAKEPTPEELFDEITKEADYDPRFVKVIKAALQNGKKVAEVEERLQQRVAHETERENRTIWSMVDDAFASMGTAGEEWFGKGDMAAIDPSSVEAKRRNMVYSDANLLPGDTAKTVERKLVAAAKLFLKPSGVTGGVTPAPEAPANPYGKTPTQAEAPRPIVTNGRAYTKEEWEEGSTVRPTHRAADDLPPGEEKAIRNLDAKLRESQRDRIGNLGLLK